MMRRTSRGVTIAVLFVLLLLVQFRPAYAAGPSPDGLRAEEARVWLTARRNELLATMAGPDPVSATRLIRGQLAFWRDAGRRLARTGGLTDAHRGYIIYPPQASLELFLLDRAERLYAAGLTAAGAAGIPRVDDLFRLGDARLTVAVPEKYPSVARVRAALDELALPAAVFRGYRLFLLPFVMGEVSGQGGPGYMFLAAEPREERLIPNQLEVTLVHEFGHYLHLAAMPREMPAGRRRWQSYLAMRGLTWREDGRVKTADWARSPEEAFAEDFRLLFGGERAARESAATEAGDPRRDEEMAASLRRFMAGLARYARPGKTIAPWPEDPGRAARPTIPYPAWAGLAVLAALAPAGLGLQRRVYARVGRVFPRR